MRMEIFATPMSAIHPSKFNRLFENIPWNENYTMGYSIISISFIQIIFFITATPSTVKLFRFEPNNQSECWRFITYMLLHTSWCHLILNIIVQCIYTIGIEKLQGSFRVLIIYFSGGITGALGAACVSPDVVVGASAGAYSLLLSHISYAILNKKNKEHRVFRCTTVVIIVLADVFYGLGHSQFYSGPIISWGAHLGGATTGLLLGLIIYRSLVITTDKRIYVKTIFWFAFLLYIIFFICLFYIQYCIKKCTPQHLTRVKYIYNC